VPFAVYGVALTAIVALLLGNRRLRTLSLRGAADAR
jgi:hypothetical protein